MYKEGLELNNLQWLYALQLNQTKSYTLNIYVYKDGLALNNQQFLICHKIQSNQTAIWSVSYHQHNMAYVWNPYTSLLSLTFNNLSRLP